MVDGFDLGFKIHTMQTLAARIRSSARKEPKAYGTCRYAEGTEALQMVGLALKAAFTFTEIERGESS